MSEVVSNIVLYGATIEPTFRSTRLSLLDRGFVYAIAHIRGSEMLGRPW